MVTSGLKTSGPAPGAVQSTPSLLVRDASGLVREVSTLHASNLVRSAAFTPNAFGLK